MPPMGGKTGVSAPYGGAGGTVGGRTKLRIGAAIGSTDGLDHASALWLLVALELGALIGLRRYFRRQHGG